MTVIEFVDFQRFCFVVMHGNCVCVCVSGGGGGRAVVDKRRAQILTRVIRKI